MKFTTHNQKLVNVAGTHLQGHIKADYDNLKKLFGNPTDGDGYKTDAEWEIEFEDGIVATIYNWKNGKNYNGASGTPKTKITNWNVGGYDQKAVELLKKILS